MTKHALIDKPAPALSLPNYDGETYTFTPGASGKPTALFFYPKAGSLGCTKEACQFRDAIAEKPHFSHEKLEVIGISADPVEAQKKFVEKNKLTYPVLSDTKGEAKKAYSVGKGIFGLTDARVTFFIDKNGVVRDVIDTTVNYGAHAKFIAKWVEKIEAEEKKAESGEAPAAEPAAAEEQGQEGTKGTEAAADAGSPSS